MPAWRVAWVFACAWGALACFGLCVGGPPSADLPKYAAGVSRLAVAHDYLRRAEAADFWALAGYYLPQPNDRACSSASVAMLVNALRAGEALAADEELATAERLAARVGGGRWQKALGPKGKGVTLDELGPLVEEALKAYGIARSTIEVVHVEDAGAKALDEFRALLERNEESADDLLLVNFQQDLLTGDPEGAVGHMAPVGAYDAAARRVLVFDPDRQWYEPYWVSDEALLAAMATRDATAGRSRGYLHVKRTR